MVAVRLSDHTEEHDARTQCGHLSRIGISKRSSTGANFRLMYSEQSEADTMRPLPCFALLTPFGKKSLFSIVPGQIASCVLGELVRMFGSHT